MAVKSFMIQAPGINPKIPLGIVQADIGLTLVKY
jgi:hypothetical protein